VERIVEIFGFWMYFKGNTERTRKWSDREVEASKEEVSSVSNWRRELPSSEPGKIWAETDLGAEQQSTPYSICPWPTSGLLAVRADNSHTHTSGFHRKSAPIHNPAWEFSVAWGLIYLAVEQLRSAGDLHSLGSPVTVRDVIGSY
jgi:hypothetical protein